MASSDGSFRRRHEPEGLLRSIGPVTRRTSPTARPRTVLLAAVVMVLGLSGCFKASQDVKVRADGTGAVVLHAEVNKRALTAFARSFGGLGAAADLQSPSFKLVDRTFPDGTKVRTTDDADRSVLDASFTFDGSDDYVRKMEQVNEAITPGSDEPTRSDGSLKVRRVDDRMEVALDLGRVTEDVVDVDLSVLGGILSPDAQPRAAVTITMPGRILETNGTANGRTATWDVLSKGAPATLTASSEIDGAGLPGWALPAVGLTLVLVVALGLVGILLSRRSRRDDEPVVPHQPGSVQPAGAPGTFFPSPPAGLPPRQPVEPSPGIPAPSAWGSGPQPGAAPGPPSPWSPPPAEGPPPSAPWEPASTGPPPAASTAPPPTAPPEAAPVAPPTAPLAAALAAAPAAPPPAAPAEDAPTPRLSIWGAGQPAPPTRAGSSPPASPKPKGSSPPDDPLPWRVSPAAAPLEATGPGSTSDPATSDPAKLDASLSERPRPESPASEPPSFERPRPVRAATEPPSFEQPHGAPPTATEPTSFEQAHAAPPPAAPPPASGPVPGWYADPAGGGGIRYWDGASWTQHTR